MSYPFQTALGRICKYHDPINNDSSGCKRAIHCNYKHLTSSELFQFLGDKSAKMLLDIAFIYFNADNYHCAMHVFKDLMTSDNRKPAVNFGLAQCYEGIGDYKNAKKFYLKAINTSPRDDRCHSLYAAFLHSKLGDLSSAATYFNNALRLNKTNPYSHCNFGCLLEAKHDFEGALFHWNECLRLDASHRKALHHLALFHHKKSRDLNHLEVSKQYFDEWMALISQNYMKHWHDYFEYALLLKDMKLWDEAIMELNIAFNATENDQQRADVLFEIGRVHDHRGDIPTARSCFQSARDYNPTMYSMYFDEFVAHHFRTKQGPNQSTQPTNNGLTSGSTTVTVNGFDSNHSNHTTKVTVQETTFTANHPVTISQDPNHTIFRNTNPNPSDSVHSVHSTHSVHRERRDSDSFNMFEVDCSQYSNRNRGIQSVQTSSDQVIESINRLNLNSNRNSNPQRHHQLVQRHDQRHSQHIHDQRGNEGINLLESHQRIKQKPMKPTNLNQNELQKFDETEHKENNQNIPTSSGAQSGFYMKNEGQTPSEREFLGYLRRLKLSQYHYKFMELGLGDMRYLSVLDANDLSKDIGMTKVHVKYFMEKMAEWKEKRIQFKKWMESIQLYQEYHEHLEGHGIYEFESFYRIIRNKQDLLHIIGVDNEFDAALMWQSTPKQARKYQLQPEGKHF